MLKRLNLVSLNYCNSYNLILRLQESRAGVLVWLQGEPQIETLQEVK